VPWCFLALTPLLFALPSNFYWARSELPLELEEHLEKTGGYLNSPFFILRTIAAGVVLSWFARRMAAGLNRANKGGPVCSFRFAAVGLIVTVLLNYFLAVDWIMSAEPRWYSSGQPVIFAMAQLVSGMALVVWSAVHHAEEAEPVDRRSWKDRGNLLFALVMFWFYVAFAQFLIVYSANLPEEITWYLHRDTGGWRLVTLLIVAGHFLVPFFLLLSVRLKTAPRRLAGVALLIGSMQLIYIHWLTLPSLRNNGFEWNWLDPVVLLALGGFCFHRFQLAIGETGGRR
jgi:hypothetical protein